MGKRWYVMGILSLILVGLFAYHPMPLMAQHLDCTFSHAWTNTVGTPDGISFFQTPQQQNTPFNPLTRPDNQYVAPDYSVPVGAWRIISQNFSSDELCTPTLVSAVWYRGTGNTGGIGIDTSMDGINWTNQITTPLGFGAGGQYTYTWSNPNSISFYHIRVTLLHYLPRLYSFSMTSPPPDETTLIKPLTNTTETSMSDVEYASGVSYVQSQSATNFVPVHAPADSVVMDIAPLNIDRCNAYNIPNCVVDGGYSVDLANTYIVGLRSYEGDEFSYIVSNAPKYLKTDLAIQGGCVMGETFRTNTPNLSATLASDGTDELLSRFTLAPNDGATSCLGEEDEIVCQLGDERMAFIYANSSKSPGVTYDGTVIRIPPGGTIAGTVALPSNERVYGEIVASGQSAVVRFGSQVQSVSLSSNFQSVVFGWRYVNEPTDFSVISLDNTGTGEMVISDICVAFESDNPPQTDEPEYPPAPPTCYFYNYTFNLGDAGWQISDTFEFRDSQVNMYHQSEIGQRVVLNPGNDVPTYYTLTVKASVWHIPPYSLAPDDLQSFSLYYRDVAGNSQDLGDDVTLTQMYESSITGQGYVTLTTQIPILVPSDWNLLIGADTSGLTGAIGLKGISIHEVCLSSDDGIWHGYEPTPDENIFAEECTPPAQLANLDSILWMLPAFAYYVQDVLEDVIGCRLMRVMNGVFSQVKAQGLIAKHTADWVGGQAVPYMGGYLANMFNFGNGVNFDAGDLTSIFSSIATIPSDFFSLLAWVTTTFFGILARIVQNFVTIFRALVEFIQTIIAIGNELIRAWNDTTATTLPGVDDCQIAPETKTRCIIFWILENTILGQPYGFLIVPVITSSLMIVALANLYVQVKRLINKVVGAT
jgi:hypothetical protein